MIQHRKRGIIIMLAELALASAAFNTVKEFISNGKELYDCGEQLVGYFDAKNSLQKKVNNAGGNKSDLEEFMALEKLKAQEDELREMMIYTGRAGMWQDWLQFQKQAAEKRREAEIAARKAAIERHENIMEWIQLTAALTAGTAVFSLLVWLFYTFAYLPKYG